MGFDLAGKVVFITGASSGIGAAAARAFAAQGCKVALAARRVPRVEKLAQELMDQGHEAMPLSCDVRDDREVREAIDAAALRFGGLDVLVNNAGVGLYGPIEEVSPEKLHENFDTNVYGALRCIRAALPHLRKRGAGQIMNVSSVLGFRALPNFGGYCASKFALNALSEAARIELKRDHIDVIVIAPSVTTSEFAEQSMTTSGRREDRGRLKEMSAEEVAAAMVRASRRRSRQVVLTGMGKAMVGINRLSPSLFDHVATKMIGPDQKPS